MQNMFGLVCGALVLLSGAALAQSVQASALPSAVPLTEEDVAPPVRTAAPSSTLASPSTATPVAAANPFSIPVSITLAGTSGFARDKALEAAAKRAMPIALSRLDPSIEAPRATEIVAKLGNAMPFVASYTIQRESLVPSYTLEATLVFNRQKLEANFGHRKTTPAATTVVSSTTENPSPSAPAAALTLIMLRLDGATPAQAHRVLQVARGLPGANARYAQLGTRETWVQLNFPGSPAAARAALNAAGVAVGQPYTAATGQETLDVEF